MDRIFEIIDNDFEFFKNDKASGHYARGVLIEENKNTCTIKLFCNGKTYKVDKYNCKELKHTVKEVVMCICEMGKVLSKTHLTNEHCDNRNIRLNLIKDDKSHGMVIFDNNLSTAVFTIWFCPVCGKKLEQETT